MKNVYVKLYEEFIDDDYEMQRVIKELEKRVNFWFSPKGELSKETELMDIKQTETAISTRKSLMVEFKPINNEDYYYQMIIRVNIENIEKCEFILKRYNPSLSGELDLDDQISFTGDKMIDVNDIKSDFVLDKIAELNGKDTNPDENDINVPKSEEIPSEGAPPEGAAQGDQPPAQPPVQGAPPAQSGAPAQAPPTL